MLSLQVTELQVKYENSLFRLKNIKHDEVIFHTGFPDFFKNILDSDAMVMKQWSGCQSKESYTEIKSGRSCKLPLLEQFILTLVRLHQGLYEQKKTTVPLLFSWSNTNSSQCARQTSQNARTEIQVSQ